MRSNSRPQRHRRGRQILFAHRRNFRERHVQAIRRARAFREERSDIESGRELCPSGSINSTKVGYVFHTFKSCRSTEERISLSSFYSRIYLIEWAEQLQLLYDLSDLELVR